MRRFGLLVVLPLVACGGANEEASHPKSAHDKSDDGFADYAATHGIQTLEGGGATAEVTADGLRVEALDKDRPVKLDGLLLEWPAPAKATAVTSGSTKAALKISLQYDASKLYVGADVN